MGFQGTGGFQAPDTPESVTETVEVCEYDAEGKLIKKTTTTTTRSMRTYRQQYWQYPTISHSTTTGNATTLHAMKRETYNAKHAAEELPFP